MNRLINKYGIVRWGKFCQILLLLAAWITVIGITGCTQRNESYTPPAVIPKADGMASAGKFRAVVIDDMDNDGKLDVVGGAASPGMVTINYGGGHGVISEPQYLAVKGEVRSVAVADVNEDGLADIVLSVQKESSGIRLFLNQSNRKWIRAKGPIDINKYEGLKAADINGDGHLDIIAANATSDTQGGVQVWLGDGKGNWPVETGPTINGLYMDVLVVDLNNDGSLDLVASGWGTYGALKVWLGDGTGKWTSTEPLAKGSYYGLSVGDLNNDGNFDIFAGSYRRGVRIFVGDGQGDFSKILSPEEVLKRQAKVQAKTAAGVGELPLPEKNRSFWQVVALDLDEDGLVDILAGSLDSQGIKAWRNLGNKGWKPFKGPFPSTGNYYEICLADLDNDRQPDIGAASFGEGIKIWSGTEGAFKVVRQQQVDQLEPMDRFAAELVTLENKVFKTIDGVAEYKIDSGDTLEISIWEGTTQQKEEIYVRPEGKVSFGFVEDLSVKGLTASQLDHLLTNYLRQYVKNPRIDVIVKEFNSKFARVMGAVSSHRIGTGPGQYKLKGKTTALEIITRAGGPSQNANLRNVRLQSKSGQSRSLNLYKAILQGDLSQNPVLDDGDLVFLPTLSETGNRVYVFGEVKKPGAYTFSGSEIRLLDVISEAGGATVNAAEYETRVVRGDPTRPEIIAANVRELVEQGDRSQNVALVNGDLIYVPRSGIGNVNRFIDQIFPTLRAIATATSIVVNFDTINTIID
ncbi:MAG: VCBS repeat-containing protein [Deltaproteobacteria bacterium]|nr:VCBS repeat-containing protein [Deltaproteobacteria bacterium]